MSQKYCSELSEYLKNLKNISTRSIDEYNEYNKYRKDLTESHKYNLIKVYTLTTSDFFKNEELYLKKCKAPFSSYVKDKLRINM
jgi:hypothetical protein